MPPQLHRHTVNTAIFMKVFNSPKAAKLFENIFQAPKHTVN